MLRLVADENVKIALIRGLRREYPGLDIVRVQEVGLHGIADPALLEWAARENRILITHDAETVPGFVYQRVAAEAPMPGVFLIPWTAPLGRILADLKVLVECSVPGEWEGQVRYLPL